MSKINQYPKAKTCIWYFLEEKAAAIRGQISNKMTGKRCCCACQNFGYVIRCLAFFAWLPLLVYFRAYQTINKKLILLKKEQDFCA